MGSFKNLPGAGSRFSARVGLGSFDRKLRAGMISSSSSLHVLRKHEKAVKTLVDEVAKNRRFISRGGITKDQMRRMKAAVVASDKLSYTGKTVVGKILNQMRRGSQPTAPKAPVKNDTIVANRRAATVQSWRMQRRSSENASKPTGVASRPGMSAPSAPASVSRPPVLQR